MGCLGQSDTALWNVLSRWTELCWMLSADRQSCGGCLFHLFQSDRGVLNDYTRVTELRRM